MNEITIIIDANYLCYVNRFALSQGLSYRGNHTEIIFGFLRHVNELARHFGTKIFIFCWDSHKSLRKEIYPEYKANRRVNQTEEENELDQIAYTQFNEIKDIILSKIGFNNIFYKEGYESDDIIASVVKNQPGRYIVVASDNDLFQLLDYCSLYNIVKKSLTTKIIFEREHKISPDKWYLVKAIAGCGADNVSGVQGVGEKTAIKFISGLLKTGKILSRIESPDGVEIFQRNSKLVTLPFDGTGTFEINNNEQFIEKDFEMVCEEYGFESLLSPRYLQTWIKLFNMK